MTVTVRPARAADLEAFWGVRPRMTMLARVAVLDGKVIAVGGLAGELGRYKAFWDIAPGHEPDMRCMAVLRAVKELQARFAETHVPIVAYGDNPGLLERLGFERMQGEDFIWRNTGSTSPQVHSFSVGNPKIKAPVRLPATSPAGRECARPSPSEPPKRSATPPATQ